MPLLGTGRWKNCPVCGCSLASALSDKRDAGVPGQIAPLETFLTHCQRVHPNYLAWEKSKVRLSALLGISISIPVTVVSFWFFIFVVHVSSSSGRGLALIPLAAFFLPLVLVDRIGRRRFRTEWREHEGLPIPRSIEPSTGDLDSTRIVDEDHAILGIASDLARQLDLDVPIGTLDTVRWQTLIPQARGYQSVPSDGCVIRANTIYFSENMKGRLRPEDWRPIIASSLIYSRKLFSKVPLGISIRLLPLLALYIVGWFLIPPFFPTTVTGTYQGKTAVNNVGWIILIFAGFAIMFLTIPIAILYTRKLKRIADSQTARQFGTGPFLETLRRISEASPSDAQSIQARIENLNRTS